MRLLAAALAAFLVAAPAFAQDADADDRWDARVSAVSGEVTVHPADGGEDAAAEADMPLEVGDRILVAQGAEATISLDDGSLITLHENSDFTLDKTERAESSFTLSLGSLMAKIQKLGSQRLTVRTPTAVAAVRGTEFGVDAEAEQTHVGVFDEGRVEVRSAAGGQEVLTPNQETSVARGKAPLKAGPLARFAARRERMRAQVRRIKTLKRRWKKLPPAQRRAQRAKILERLREIRRTLQEKRRQQQERKEKRGARGDGPRHGPRRGRP